MEVATIDWNDSKFEKDELYEEINAPQWIDFSANPPPLDDDDAWFCRPDCNHPKTADDFFMKTMHDHCKHQRSANVSEISPLDDLNQSPFSNTKVKKKVTPLSKISKTTKHVQDIENQNPNFSTPRDHAKSSTVKKKEDKDSSLKETPRKLKNTFSARNLFAGNNIFNQITEFCNELKRLATRKKEKGDDYDVDNVEKLKEVGVLKEREIQKKPFLEATKLKDEIMDNSNTSSNYKQKVRNKKQIKATR